CFQTLASQRIIIFLQSDGILCTIPLLLASTTPDSDAKRVRLKTALFLQGSKLYDVRTILERLSPHEKILKFEMAILHGKAIHLFFLSNSVLTSGG
ncbi:hypothetical protein MPER_01608, partial [Moniliophthora perniciosa FA553]